jgi:8-oxo-dGTP diphosphatase
MALARRKWDQADADRPLTKRGQRQAEELPRVLGGYIVEAALSSPAVRCMQTIRPLAAGRGLAVQEVDALAEGATRDAVELVDQMADRVGVLCSHGDVIPYVLNTLARRDALDLGVQPSCAKGSTWVLEHDGTRWAKAFYIDAPA